MFNPTSYPPTSTPFVIVNENKHITAGNVSFHPSALMVITPALRTSGLLASLSPEDLKNLITALTFLTTNGSCTPSVPELATAMGVSTGKAMSRMNRLVSSQWRNESLFYFLEHESGLNAYAPSHSLVAVVRENPKEPEAPPPIRSVREEVIALSRERYTRSREEVERDIAKQNGWGVPEEFATDEEKEQGELLRRLCTVGLERGEANEILAQHPVERIRRQLDWLPYRRARLPARYLVAAIEGDYEAPLRQKGYPHEDEMVVDLPVNPEE